MHKTVPAYNNGAPRAAAPSIGLKDTQAKNEPVFTVAPNDPAHTDAAARHNPAHAIASMQQPIAPVIAATRHRLAHAIAATQQTLTPAIAHAQHITQPAVADAQHITPPVIAHAQQMAQPAIADAQQILTATARSPELAVPLIQNGDAPQSAAAEMQDTRQIGPATGQPAMSDEGCRQPPFITAFKTSYPLRGMRQRSLETLAHNGLTHFKKWWYRREVDLYIRGERITGTPIFLHDNTIRVVNDAYSYFIPLHKVDYIRTTDGLRDD